MRNGILLLFLVVSAAGANNLASGLQPGEDVVPWNPIHVAGPNKGTKLCPVCTYLELPAVLVFTKDGADAAELTARLETLLGRYEQRQLKGFVVFTDSTPERLKQAAERLKIARTGVCYPAADTRAEDLQAYRVNPQATNTVMVYKDYKVVATFVNLAAKDFGGVEEAVKKALR